MKAVLFGVAYVGLLAVVAVGGSYAGAIIFLFSN